METLTSEIIYDCCFVPGLACYYATHGWKKEIPDGICSPAERLVCLTYWIIWQDKKDEKEERAMQVIERLTNWDMQ